MCQSGLVRGVHSNSRMRHLRVVHRPVVRGRQRIHAQDPYHRTGGPKQMLTVGDLGRVLDLRRFFDDHILRPHAFEDDAD